MTSKYNKTQRTKAIQYLRSRGKYLADHGCTFKPTSAAATDVAETWQIFRLAQEKINNLNVRRLK